MRIQILMIALIVMMPGCITEEEIISIIEDLDDTYNSDLESSNVTLNIFQGESLANSTVNYSITIMLNHTAAPAHSDNFRGHVLAGNYNMTHFHRVIDDFMIQGGDFENHDGTGGYASAWFGVCNGDMNVNQSDCPSQEYWNVPDEAYNGLAHLPCTISMAKTSAPNSGGSQFFIIPEDSTPSWLDGVHTVFGVVTDGCEHITEISEVTTGTRDVPVTPVIIYNATAMD